MGATFAGSQMSTPSPSCGAKSRPKVFTVIRVRARGAITLQVTPYFSISRATTHEREMIPPFAEA